MDLRAHLQQHLDATYAVEREIGAGGMATVWLARDLKHDRQVAIKVLNAELGAVLGVERFLAEIRVTANLQHPNLLPLFDSGDAGGLLYYVMPFVAGETLRARLEREKQLPVDEAVRIAVAVGHALDYAHENGVIHRLEAREHPAATRPARHRRLRHRARHCQGGRLTRHADGALARHAAVHVTGTGSG